MAQQGMAIVSLISEVVDMGDYEFITDKVKAGDWIELTGPINAITDEISFIPASGKTFFPNEASIVMTANPNVPVSGGTRDQIVAALKIDTITKDKAKIGIDVELSSLNNAGGGFGTQSKSYFNARGLSLVGDGFKAITIENIVDNGFADATFSGFIEDT